MIAREHDSLRRLRRMSREQINQLIQAQKQYFAEGHTRDITKRQQALYTLIDAIQQHEAAIVQALQLDLRKSETEAYVTEIGFTLAEARHLAKRLTRWAKPRKVKTALTHIGSRGMVVPEPYGTALIIAPWNYPFQLALAPLIGAIAAGNTAVLKPSEWTPHTSAVLSTIIRDSFDPRYVAVVEGAVETSQTLLELPFDYIFFTGSVGVGKKVMEAAAKRLIPITLELGGKSPCIVHQDADIQLAARRIAFGKWTNAGQTCVAPDYIYVHHTRREALVQALHEAVVSFYGQKPLESNLYPSIVSNKHLARLTTFLDEGSIAWGGHVDADNRRMEPTVLTDVDWTMKVMEEEIFGPLLPVLTYEHLDEVIHAVRARPKPLALYLFTSEREVQHSIIEQLSFGGGCVNDTLMHLATPYLPFGGVGESGTGRYHGKYSFDTFSHNKAVLYQTTAFDLSLRYPGVKNGLRWMKKLLR
ncbi:aldehyde dehydrogenase [Paenibacillus sp. UMB4589-SE434]|uniref:aldehyde dehydrogenase n=1 Tax=Paenibacillus sp. UMB4589-SE434 TaxID=3046314 RepID=UPI00254E0A4B|nr:aldehyde dehydrogenase [Paenibacillus sp. UMB4589-SE434]MDK8183963.1 aldehyde dehydrogenase [Paenibacillus sp. UMB4589-SE434]